MEGRFRDAGLIRDFADPFAGDQPFTDDAPKLSRIALGHGYLQVAHDQTLISPDRFTGSRLLSGGDGIRTHGLYIANVDVTPFLTVL